MPPERGPWAGADWLGERYLGREEIAARVRELGAQLAADYEDREPLLVAPLKSSLVFLADLSRAMPILHWLDFVELAPFNGESDSSAGVRLLKDLDEEIEDREVVIVEDIIDTGLTLNFLCRTFTLRKPRSLGVVSLLDRPYRRLVDDLPVRYVGFTAPDEYFVGYGFDLDERYRNLPDIYVVPAQGAPGI